MAKKLCYAKHTGCSRPLKQGSMARISQMKEDLKQKITIWQREVDLKLMKIVWGAHVRTPEEDEPSEECVCEPPQACLCCLPPPETVERDLLYAYQGSSAPPAGGSPQGSGQNGTPQTPHANAHGTTGRPHRQGTADVAQLGGLRRYWWNHKCGHRRKEEVRLRGRYAHRVHRTSHRVRSFHHSPENFQRFFRLSRTRWPEG